MLRLLQVRNVAGRIDQRDAGIRNATEIPLTEVLRTRKSAPSLAYAGTQPGEPPQAADTRPAVKLPPAS